ncbi:DUF1232 domain-containing protein [Colwellia sp. MB02u-14]|uniref:DUF1232 domain-containing protein n=1 Tax=Colwellia sp. MB02u-14 TaxID=2759815 RepID=UPI0015F60B3B|nr:DUF1232 domain-containing protein [Colwellia sp. MB02u-14]MBA6303297.1 DUF1232 domain-containing protein [Colwellia sp. MB02u-14]
MMIKLLLVDELNSYTVDLDNSKSSMNTELISQISILMTLLATRPENIAVSALSYYFLPEDYIKNDIPDVGLMDDLYVFRTAAYYSTNG